MAAASSSPSVFAGVSLAPPDPIFNLTASYKADTFAQKVNVGVGAYRTDQGKPWILPVVAKVEKEIVQDTSVDHEYLPIDGLPAFTHAAAKLVLGADSPVIASKRYCSVQCISGTGSVRTGAEFLSRFFKGSTVLISDPTWANHKPIFNDAGLPTRDYPYFNPATNGLDLQGMLAALENAAPGTIVLLHGCAHNPTGVDPTQEQWMKIGDVVKKRGLFPFFDCAYQGFASGDLARDAWAVRYFAHTLNLELFVAQSFSKNFGLYGERVGALVCVASDATAAERVRSQMCKILRPQVSNPPSFGARIVARVLSDEALYKEWVDNLNTMSSRILHMRKTLHARILALNTPGNWTHIIDQIGMFTYTGLNPLQVKAMVDRFHVYMTTNGRISLAGLTSENVGYVAEAIHWVVVNVK